MSTISFKWDKRQTCGYKEEGIFHTIKPVQSSLQLQNECVTIQYKVLNNRWFIQTSLWHNHRKKEGRPSSTTLIKGDWAAW